MSNKFDLSETETQIMEYLWNNNNESFFKDMLSYINNDLKKDWKKQTLRSFLVRLEEKQYVYIDKTESKYKYVAIKSKKEHMKKLSKGILNKFFNNSIYDFLSAFSGNENLSSNDAEQLKQFLEQDK